MKRIFKVISLVLLLLLPIGMYAEETSQSFYYNVVVMVDGFVYLVNEETEEGMVIAAIPEEMKATTRAIHFLPDWIHWSNGDIFDQESAKMYGFEKEWIDRYCNTGGHISPPPFAEGMVVRSRAVSARNNYTIPISGTRGEEKPYSFKLKFIGQNAFANSSWLTELVIPETVECIWPGAFMDCTNLTSVIIPESIKEIDFLAFYGCTSLTSVKIPQSVTYLGNGVFRNCTSLSSATLESPVDKIEGSLFNGCKALKSIEIPSSAKYIGAFAFMDCENLTIVKGGENVDSINLCAFENCYKLESVPTFSNVTVIKERAFMECYSLKSFTFSASLKEIQNYAFIDCDLSASSLETATSLVSLGTSAFNACQFTSFVIPKSVLHVGPRAFANCSNLKSITLSPQMSSLEDEMFMCSSIESIAIPSSIETIGQGVFDQCRSLKEVLFESDSKLTSIGDQAFSNCILLTTFSMPDQVCNIGSELFHYCESLETLKLSASLKQIAEKEFYAQGLNKLTTVTFGANAVLESIGDGAFSQSPIKTFEMPTGVKKIGNEAFSKCKNLVEVKMPNTVTSLGERAYYNCSALSDLTLSSGLTEIGANAFSSCWALSSIVIPEGVKIIGNSAFSSCIEVTSLTLPSTITTIGNDAFNSLALTSLTLPQNVTSIGERAFAFLNDLETVYAKMETPATLADDAFTTVVNGASGNVYDNASLYVPDNTKSLYESANGWKKFHNIIDNAQKYISYNGLNYCVLSGEATVISGDYSEMKSVVIPATIKVDEIDVPVTSIGEMAFKGCGNLIQLTFGSNIKAIGDNAFSNCGIRPLELPEGIEVIGKEAFSYCTRIQELVLPSTLKNIGSRAFYPTYNITKIVSNIRKPFSIPEDTFENPFTTDDPIPLYVPAGTSELYKETDFWSRYTNIMEVEDTESEVIKDGDTFTAPTDGVEMTFKVLSAADKTCQVGSGEYNEPAIEKAYKGPVTIPATISGFKVIAVGDFAFRTTDITSAIISEGVETIGEGVFRGCGDLKTLELPSTLKSIGENMFVVLADDFPIDGDITDVEAVISHIKEPFDISTVVFGIYNPGPPDDSEEGEISLSRANYKALAREVSGYPTNAILYVPTGTKDKYKAIKGWTMFKDILEMGDTETESLNDGDTFEATANGATFRCKVISAADKTCQVGADTPLGEVRNDYWGDAIVSSVPENVTVPSKVTADDGTEFIVTAIGSGAFTGYNMESATLPSTIKEIGYMAFAWCRSMKSISLPEGLTTIGTQAFDGNGLTSVEIPSTVTSIGLQAFYGMRKLTDVISKIAEPFALNTYPFTDLDKLTLTVPVGTLEVYKNTDGWKEFGTIVEMGSGETVETEPEPITISAAKQVPYCSDKNLDFTNKPELKAYVATGYDKSTGTIWLTRVMQVPAETGFLLLGDAGDYDIPTIDGVSEVYYKNMFKGTLTGTTIQTTDGDYTNYYLSNGTSGVGFYKVTNENGQKIGANRCYLPILTNIPAEGSEGDAEVIKVSAAKQVPYYTSKNIDFTTLDAQGVKAYTATGYNYGTGVIWLTRVKKVPAQTGILVMADKEGEYSVPTTSVQSIYENMFTGSETAQTIYTTETVGDIEYINYYLSNGTSGVGFYKVTNENGQKMGANRSYLQIPKREKAAGARDMDGHASFCKMMISDNDDDVIGIPVYGGDATGIINTQFQNADQDVYYNLQGQRIDRPRKGLYIHNGKMVVIN